MTKDEYLNEIDVGDDRLFSEKGSLKILCFVCDQSAESLKIEWKTSNKRFKCEDCGIYEITWRIYRTWEFQPFPPGNIKYSKDDKNKIKAWLINQGSREPGKKCPVLTTEIIYNILI